MLRNAIEIISLDMQNRQLSILYKKYKYFCCLCTIFQGAFQKTGIYNYTEILYHSFLGGQPIPSVPRFSFESLRNFMQTIFLSCIKFALIFGRFCPFNPTCVFLAQSQSRICLCIAHLLHIFCSFLRKRLTYTLVFL